MSIRKQHSSSPSVGWLRHPRPVPHLTSQMVPFSHVSGFALTFDRESLIDNSPMLIGFYHHHHHSG
jgi:hypothetical protein